MIFSNIPIFISMKMIFLLFICLFSLSSKTQAALDYKINEEQFLYPSTIESIRFEEYFSKFELDSLSQNSLFKFKQLYDFAYTSSDLEKYVLLKAGVVVPENEYGVFYHEEEFNAVVTHIKVNDISYLFIAKGFEKAEIKNLLAPFIKKESLSLFNLIIPSAHAFDGFCLPKFYQPSILSFEANYQKINQSMIGSQITSCAIDALKSMKSSLESAYSFYKDLLTNPKKVWNETLKSFESMKQLIANLNSEFKNLVHVIGHLSTEEQIKIVCNLTGDVVMLAAGALLTGPQNLAKEAPRFLLKIKNLTASLKKVNFIDKIGLKAQSQKRIQQEIISCAK